ncbi:sulfite exporter TauE/SafE family protein [Candidatus Gracilibacteria bacterium]|nr:sulfite exporter TauE/SafE family protein [Candidatus Gracilibacteria bacterium]
MIAFGATMMGAFVGGSSSLILFPLLLLLFGGPYVSLFAVNKISATIMTLVAALVHRTRMTFDMKLLSWLSIFYFIGTVLGTYLLQYQFDENLFKTLLGAVIFITSFYLFFSGGRGLQDDEDFEMTTLLWFFSAIFFAGTGVLNGIFSGLGIMMTLFLVFFCRMSCITATGYMMVMGLVTGIPQTLYLLWSVDVDLGLVMAVVVGALFGAYVGTHLQYLKGNAAIKRTATFVLIMIGLAMFF